MASTSKPHFQHPQAATLARRQTEPRRFMQFVTGPRQVGKSTLVRQVTEGLGVPVPDFLSRPVTHWMGSMSTGSEKLT